MNSADRMLTQATKAENELHVVYTRVVGMLEKAEPSSEPCKERLTHCQVLATAIARIAGQLAE